MQSTPKWIVKTGIGQDSHRFLPEGSSKPCILGGVIFENVPGFHANSDGDVIFHALCNALTSITQNIILGKVADDLLNSRGITDSGVYLKEAVKGLKSNQQISHVAITLEGSRPRFLPKIELIRESVSSFLGVSLESIGITATSGEGLSDYGCGDGVQCFCIITVIEHLEE
ncbi:2-C-methyl-D-erythritol 2,4-cyclodiphosphate synthase [Chlamydiifrater phoenicopteri]|uniref:2-C-methyl-D-erythritol 2,4-cyclodiphosphate synthase n=1 Tax=Chlamydiifrater phoenicopteri TaxID=2681469 RepID=UPI001BCEFAB5|nr:2-C-methyl-D-erythritol 2,4-cyclodiphosphate synthase [Chlamydiifrater phoenicopteri]